MDPFLVLQIYKLQKYKNIIRGSDFENISIIFSNCGTYERILDILDSKASIDSFLLIRECDFYKYRSISKYCYTTIIPEDILNLDVQCVHEVHVTLIANGFITDIDDIVSKKNE
jgi:hypothetical protein